jgi:hypothetical protein
MLLVADDASAAYSNPRPLPKVRADSPAVYSSESTAPRGVQAPFACPGAVGIMPGQSHPFPLKKPKHPCRNWYGRYSR